MQVFLKLSCKKLLGQTDRKGNTIRPKQGYMDIIKIPMEVVSVELISLNTNYMTNHTVIHGRLFPSSLLVNRNAIQFLKNPLLCTLCFTSRNLDLFPFLVAWWNSWDVVFWLISTSWNRKLHNINSEDNSV